jgi:hypothetical protein
MSTQPGRTVETAHHDMATTLRDDHLAAIPLKDLWAASGSWGRSRRLRLVRRCRASSGRFAFDCGVHFRTE